MKIALFLIFTIHALIHGLGFIKAFQFMPLPQLPLQISKSAGLLWLLSALILLFAGISMALSWSLWWALAFAAVVLSQILIFQTWSEARFGTIMNILIIPAALMAMGSWSFERTWLRLKQDMSRGMAPGAIESVIGEDDIRDLPLPLQKWLRWSGVIGRPRLTSVYLIQKGAMRLKPEQTDPMISLSEQLILPQQNAFIWKVQTRMTGLPVLGRDMFHDGKGSMWISLGGLIPVVNVAHNPKINQSALQRFLGEIIWVPSAVLHPSLVWRQIDEHSVEATMNWAGTQGSGVFHFLPDGRPHRFVAQRFKDVQDEKPLEWTADIEAYRTFDDLQIPSRVKATWMLPSGPFTWFEIEIEDAQFD